MKLLLEIPIKDGTRCTGEGLSNTIRRVILGMFQTKSKLIPDLYGHGDDLVWEDLSPPSGMHLPVKTGYTDCDQNGDSIHVRFTLLAGTPDTVTMEREKLVASLRKMVTFCLKDSPSEGRDRRIENMVNSFLFEMSISAE